MLANWVAAVMLSAFLAIVGYRRQHKQEQYFDGRQDTRRVWQWGIVLFLSMVTGILARYYWELLGQGRTIGDTSAADLVRPLLISPLVFYPIWGYSSRTPEGLTTVLIAFQNGFFWQAVFDTAGPIK
jgi:H+/Cl- antiporter ClcA